MNNLSFAMSVRYLRTFLTITFFFVFVPCTWGQPVITSFSPTSGPVGTTVTITGSNFSTTPANNIVYFGAVRANVTAATASSLSVIIPSGTTYKPITVTTGGLTAFSSLPFLVTFTGGGQITSSSFGARQDFTTDIRPNAVALSDFDGDGKIDVATANNHSNAGFASVSILRNTSSGGTISFAPKQDIVTGAVTYCIASGDIDGDGKHDIVSGSIASSNISVYRNTSTSGNISFAPKIDIAVTGSPYDIAIRDMDGDGKSDIAIVDNGITFNGMCVFRNTGTIGTISFAPKIDFTTQLSPKSIIAEDLDGDGKTDIGFTNQTSTSFSVYRNTSTIGSVSFATRIDYPCGSGNVPYSLSLADIDGDNKMDIGVVYTNTSVGGGIQLYRNTSTAGNIVLGLATSLTGGAFSNTYYHSAFDDINGDGKPDLALTIGSNATTRIYPNNSTVGSFSFGILSNLTNSFAPYTASWGDIDGDGRTDLIETEFTAENISVFKNNCGSPIVNSFTPATGGTGTVVTIFGSNFLGATSVKFGGVAAASFGVNNANNITATVSNGASGEVEVTNALGTGALSGFVYPTPPTITSFTPAMAGTGTTVTITGTNFVGTTAVTFGGIAASSFTVVNATTITAVVGAGTSGAVQVTNGFGTGTLAGFTFIPAPSVTQFTPATGGAGTAVTITGTNFQNASAVTFGGVAAAAYTVNSATSITATVANGGTGTVAVTTPGGIGSLGTYFYPPPAITSINPVTANVGSTITITGSGFSPTPAGNTVFFGQVKGVVQAATATQLTVTIPAGASYGPVSLTVDNIRAHSRQHFIPSFAGGMPLNDGSFAAVFDSLMPNLVTKFVMADYDGDLKPDLGFTSANFKVFRNLSTVAAVALAPRQEFTLGTAPFGGAVGDFNGDGKPDMAASNFTSGEVNVLRNISAPGTIDFAPKLNFPISSGQPGEVIVTDIDKDGKDDIAVAVRNPNKIVILRNTSEGNIISFTTTTINVVELPSQMVSADIDGDAKPDIAYTNGSNTNLSLLRNTSIPGSISFEAVLNVTMPGRVGALAVGDIDNDGKPELISAVPVGAFAYVVSNTSNPGTFSFAGISVFQVDNDPGGITIADVDGDGKPDILATSINAKTSVLRNTSTSGNISFEAKRSYAGWSYVMGTIDLNVDGKTDIVESELFGSGRVLFIKNQVGGPSVTSFTPASGSTGNTITITGSDFTGATAVRFGGTSAASFVVVNSTTITAVVANGASGNVEVVTPAGTAIRPGFTYIGPPVITSFSPTTATTNNTVVITGTGFTGATAVSFGGIPAGSFGVVSSTTINAAVGTGASGDVSVTTPVGTGTKSGFTYVGAPAITSFTPTSAVSGTTVTITGVNFLTVSNVSFGGTSASSFNHVNSTTITAVVGAGNTGFVVVSSTNGSASLAGFTFIGPPGISSFSPLSGTTGSVITITGSNFTGATAVSFGGTPATSFTVVNSTTITAVVGAGATGSISVTTPGGTATKSGFTYSTVTAVIDPSAVNSAELTVAPNPGDDIILIKHPSSAKGATLQFYDVTGRNIMEIKVGRSVVQTEVNVNSLSPAVYYILWNDEKRKLTRVFMVK